MINLRYAMLLIAAAITITSCSKKSSSDNTPASPVAVFSYSLSPCNTAPSTASYVNHSTNATSYSWSFGDNNNNTSTSPNPTHTYNTAGVYTVTLTATGDGGSNTVSTTVNVIAGYTIAKITSITLTQFPTRDSLGNSWDASDGPDIYFKIFKNDTAHLVANYDSLVNNNFTGPSFVLNLLSYPFQVPSFSDTMYVALFDKETTAPDSVMGKGVKPLVGFRLNDVRCSHPSTLDISSAADSLKFTIGITWQ